MTTTKIALVTGGSRGLGKSAALHLADGGVDVIVTYQARKSDAEATVAALEPLAAMAWKQAENARL